MQTLPTFQSEALVFQRETGVGMSPTSFYAAKAWGSSLVPMAYAPFVLVGVYVSALRLLVWTSAEPKLSLPSSTTTFDGILQLYWALAAHHFVAGSYAIVISLVFPDRETSMLVAMLLLVFMHLAPSFGRKIAQLSYMQTLVCILLTIDATDGPGTNSRKERVKILHIECKEGEKQSGEAARTFGSALERAMPRTKTDVEVLKSHRINTSSSFKGECALLVAASSS